MLKHPALLPCHRWTANAFCPCESGPGGVQWWLPNDMTLNSKLWLAAACAATVALSGCHKGPADGKDPKKDAKDDALPVEGTTLARGGIEATLRNSTHLEAEGDVRH